MIETEKEFNDVLSLIQEAKSRAFGKVNAELVMLYFKVGKIVSFKVSQGLWGGGTVNALANFIDTKLPRLKGFNRRGLYRMKQFYETYTNPQIVSTVMTQSQIPEIEAKKVVTTMLTQLQWSAHLHILNKTKNNEQKLFYLQYAINEKLSVRELERQLNTAVYERTKLSNKTLGGVQDQFFSDSFKDSLKKVHYGTW